MNQEEKPDPEGHEQNFQEFAKHASPKPAETGGGGGAFLRGCGIAVGIVVLLFFFIVGTCFLR